MKAAASVQQHPLDDATWLASIGGDPVRNVRTPVIGEQASPELIAALRRSDQRRAERRIQEARHRRDQERRGIKDAALCG